MKSSLSLKIIIISIMVLITGSVIYYFFFLNKMPVRHVIIISMDTTRPDHFGCYGNTWVNTPSVDALAKESILFKNYITVTPVTLPSHTSLFTGKYPLNHGTPANNYIVDNSNLMLPEILKSYGFETIGVIGAFPISKRFNFAQGFDLYDENFDLKNISRPQRTADEVTNSALRILDEKEIPENLFLFVHYFDPHNPYKAPQEYLDMNIPQYKKLTYFNGKPVTDASKKEKKKARAYAGEISFMDKHIGRLLEGLKQRKILQDSILIITSDHGENMFWDRNPFSHGWDTYQGVIKAFCLIRTPNTPKHPQHVDDLIGSIDIFPSLLDYLNLPIPKKIDGKAFDITNHPLNIPDRDYFVEATKPNKTEKSGHWRNLKNAQSIIEKDFKYILTPLSKKKELYNLKNDPFERRNLILSKLDRIKKKIKKMKFKLKYWIAKARSMKFRLKENKEKKAKEKLRSLGYL